MPRDQVFISYSHKDTRSRDELETHLKPHLRAGSITSWSDRQIVPGSQWFKEIESTLANSKIAVLLVSSDFLASDFIYKHELGPLLKKAEEGGVKILWVPVRYSAYKLTPLKNYQAVLDPGKPLAAMTKADRDTAWVKICEQIQKAVNPSPLEGTHQSALSNIPDRNPFFTDREPVLARLREALAGRRRAALSGLGGVGKTQTAVEYAHRHLGEYDHAFWATAASGEALRSSYVTIASLLRLPEAEAQDQTQTVDAIKRWFVSHPRWLLVLDDVDDVALARAFMPSGNNGHVLLTTQTSALGEIALSVVDLPKIDIDESAVLLLRRSKYIAEDAPLNAASEIEQAMAKKIAEQLDGLPLALDQAGAYIEETACGLSGYLELYQKYAPELLRRRGLAFGHPDPVDTTWVLSFENIEKASPAAAELLRFCAFLHPNAIPEELFSKGSKELGPILGVVGSNWLMLNSAISEILKYSLLRRDRVSHTIEIHSLVQTVLKQEMDEATQQVWAECMVRAVDCAFPKVEFSNWPLCERLLPQAQVCTRLINQWGFEFREAAELLNKFGVYLFERSQYAEAELLYNRALAIYEKPRDRDDSVVARSLNSLALLYHAQGSYAQAEPLLNRALKIYETVRGPEHPDVAQSLNGLAGLNYAQGQYAKAESLYQRALAIREKALGPEHQDVANSLNNLAELYDTQGHYAKAEPLCQRALAIQEKVLGPEHPDVATSLNNLATLYDHQGQYAKAESLCQRALSIREKVLGAEHPDVATNLNNLGGLYYAQGQYAKAESLYQRALAIREKALGPEHPDVAASLNNLAGLYYTQGQYAKAEPIVQRALAIREKVLGSEHPGVAGSLNSLALLYASQGQYAKADPLYQRALAIAEKALGPEHPEVATCLNNLAALYDNQGQYARAEPPYQRALAIREKALGPEHPHVAISLNNLATLYCDQGQYAKAEPFLERALTIREKALGPEHQDVANSLNNLAKLYDTQGHYAKAEPLYQRALAIQEKVLGPEHPDVATSLESYAHLLRNMDRPREAARFESRARAIGVEHT